LKTVRMPEWPLNQLVTYELRDLRAELEKTLPGLPEQSADRQLLEQRLAEVISEQGARETPADAGQWADQPG
jgi:hypothetical protein